MTAAPRRNTTTTAPIVDQLAVTAPPSLAEYVAARVITTSDVSAAAMLVDMARRDTPALDLDLRSWIAICLALRAPRDGHTCVDLSDTKNWAGDIDLSAADHPDWPEAAGPWIDSLAKTQPLVGSPGARSPFILDGERLYVARAFYEEQEISRHLVRGSTARISILLGGPGTGKTTKVATRLIERLTEQPDTEIALAAPTGKAAARMAEALRSRLEDARAPESIRTASQSVRDKVSQLRPLTIHKLLANRPHGTPRYRVNAKNKLACSLVVVDEASMLSSSLMHHLLAALGDKTELLLVGDPNQLASVDAGTVLGDIAAAASLPGSPLESRTEKLTVRHRFGPRIGALADAILEGDGGVSRAFEILERRWSPPQDPTNTKPDNPESIRWIEPGSKEFSDLVEEVVAHARQLRALAKEGNASEALKAQKKLQVLCAHRAGSAGVSGWNVRVEQRLEVESAKPWYSGRPLMVTRNNPALDVFNGDVGIVVPDKKEGRTELVLPKAGDGFKRLPVSRLEDVETVHALTIHKSQGSEYDHAIVVLPDKPSRILTRELLYTGVTRASEQVTVVGSREVIESAIRTPIRRATGLAERLKGG
jgi:exodeoxyribonuclease V alpha subunit